MHSARHTLPPVTPFLPRSNALWPVSACPSWHFSPHPPDHVHIHWPSPAPAASEATSDPQIELSLHLGWLWGCGLLPHPWPCPDKATPREGGDPEVSEGTGPCTPCLFPHPHRHLCTHPSLFSLCCGARVIPHCAAGDKARLGFLTNPCRSGVCVTIQEGVVISGSNPVG